MRIPLKVSTPGDELNQKPSTYISQLNMPLLRTTTVIKHQCNPPGTLHIARMKVNMGFYEEQRDEPGGKLSEAQFHQTIKFKERLST